MARAPSTPLAAAALGVRLLLELGALVAVGYRGSATRPGLAGLTVGAAGALALATVYAAVAVADEAVLLARDLR